MNDADGGIGKEEENSRQEITQVFFQAKIRSPFNFQAMELYKTRQQDWHLCNNYVKKNVLLTTTKRFLNLSILFCPLYQKPVLNPFLPTGQFMAPKLIILIV